MCSEIREIYRIFSILYEINMGKEYAGLLLPSMYIYIDGCYRRHINVHFKKNKVSKGDQMNFNPRFHPVIIIISEISNFIFSPIMLTL